MLTSGTIMVPWPLWSTLYLLPNKTAMRQTTPDTIDFTVRDFCASIRPDKEPAYIIVNPESDAVPRNCYPNVKRRIERAGGTILHGWIIWLSPGLFIEGEHHAIWVSPEGEWVDVTPQLDGEKRLLFLPDPENVWHGRPISNRRRPLSTDPRLGKFLRLAEKGDRQRAQSDDDGWLKTQFEMLALSQSLGITS